MKKETEEYGCLWELLTSFCPDVVSLVVYKGTLSDCMGRGSGSVSESVSRSALNQPTNHSNNQSIKSIPSIHRSISATATITLSYYIH